MHRLACVDVPALPLQLLLQQQPDWAELPVAVVAEDKPQGRVLWVNKAARAGGILPGHRYASALALASGLRARPISPLTIEAGVADLLGRLRDFSPGIEPMPSEPGVFWLDAGGLEGLFDSIETWAEQIRQTLSLAGYVAGIAVGFRRCGTFAIARALQGRKVLVLETLEAETKVMGHMPLSMLDFPAEARDALAKMGIERLRDFIALPGQGIEKRFGAEAALFHRFASGEVELPLSAKPPAITHEEHQALDYRETNVERLVFMLKPMVDRLLAALAGRGQALTDVRVRLDFEDLPPREEHIRTARPTLSSVTVMELVKLRLSATPFPAAVLGFAVIVAGLSATAEQLDLLAQKPRRDLEAAARAFARLRAAFGREDVVVRAVPRDRHTPEGRFAFEPMTALSLPHPAPKTAPALVRQFFARPIPLPTASQCDRDGWLICGPTYGPVDRLNGPYCLSGGWWRGGVERLYYFAHLRRGGLLWLFYDQRQGGWFLQAEII